MTDDRFADTLILPAWDLLEANAKLIQRMKRPSSPIVPIDSPEMKLIAQRGPMDGTGG